MTKRSVILYLSIIALLLLGVIGWYVYSFLSQPKTTPASFDGLHAYTDVQTQVNFGSRVPETEGHAKVQEWIRIELESTGRHLEIQNSEALGHPVKNVG